MMPLTIMSALVSSFSSHFTSKSHNWVLLPSFAQSHNQLPQHVSGRLHNSSTSLDHRSHDTVLRPASVIKTTSKVEPRPVNDIRDAEVVADSKPRPPPRKTPVPVPAPAPPAKEEGKEGKEDKDDESSDSDGTSSEDDGSSDSGDSSDDGTITDDSDEMSTSSGSEDEDEDDEFFDDDNDRTVTKEPAPRARRAGNRKIFPR